MRAFIQTLTLLGCMGFLAAWAEDPKKEKELTPEERKELEAKAKEFNAAGVKAYQAGNLPEAEKAFGSALEMRQRLYPKQDHPDIATSLNNLARVLQTREKNTDAEPRFREALEMRQRLYPKQDHPHVATSLNNLAFVLKACGKDAEAEPLYRDALEMRQRLYPKQDHPDVALSLSNLARVLEAREKFPQAEPLCREALRMRRRLYPKQDHPDVAMSLVNLGFVLEARGKYAEAEPFCREALEMHQRLYPKQDHPHVAMSLNNLAVILKACGKYAEAEPLCREALWMRRRLYPKQDHPDVAASLDNLAIILGASGKEADAEPLCREALEMHQRLYPKQDHPDVARSLNHLAISLQDRGKYADAEPLLREALGIYQRLHPEQDNPQVARSLVNLARLLRDRGEYANAEPFGRDAVEMYRRLHLKQDHPDIALSLNNLATILNFRGKYAEAELRFRDALEMRERLYPKQDHPDVGTSLNNLAVVLKARGEYVDAELLYREALRVAQRLYPKQDHPHVATSLDNLAILLHDREKYAEADGLHRQALRIYRGLAVAQAVGGSEGDALTLVASQPLTLSLFLSNAVANGSAPRSVYTEVSANKGFVARVAEQRGLLARTATDPEATNILAELREIRRRRAEMLLAPMPADPRSREARDKDLDNYAERIKKLDNALRPLLPALDRLEKLDKATLADLQLALPADAVFLDLLGYTYIDRDQEKPGKEGVRQTPRYAAFVVTRDAVQWIDLKEAAPVEKAVNVWRRAITGEPERNIRPAPVEETAKLGKQVRELVWEPIRKALPAGVKVVYISPDKVLTGVPWAAIPGDKPSTILLEDYAIAVVPHGVFLLDQLWPQDPPTNRPTGLLAVGGVPYGSEPEKVGLWAVAIARTRARTRGEPPADPKKPLAWDELPGAKIEAEQIVARAKKRDLDTRLLSGPVASTDRVLSELGHAKYAHIATHGFFADAQFRSVLQVDPKLFEFQRGGRERVGHGAINPMVMSGLVFAGANRPETPARGIVTGESLLDRDLSGLELAVLSACETGLGNVAGGEGVFGLQRAFHVAGARNVVASLWKVPDAATAALMGEFYRQLWDKKQPPIEALRQAQLAVYRADPKDFRAMALRGGYGKGDKEPPNIAEIGKPMPGGKTNPPVLWAAFSLSGLGR